MPPWTGAVCERWRQVLEQLETDPEALSRSLDWPIKLGLFKRYAETRFGLAWDQVNVWSQVVEHVHQFLSDRNKDVKVVDNAFVSGALGNRSSIVGRKLKRLSRVLGEHGLKWEMLDAFYQLRLNLRELDVRFGQLWPEGIFLNLERAGVLRHQVLPEGAYESAIENPPAYGRARVRGECIRRLAAERQRYTAAWDKISGGDRWLDLSDPFEQRERWKTIRRRGVPFEVD